MLEELKSNNLECTGCGACMNICPVDAICMEPNALGFLEPLVVEDKCIHCDLCLITCPVLDEQECSHAKEPECFAVLREEKERDKSSSAAVYPALARDFVNDGGTAYGVVWSDDFYPHFAGAVTEAEIEKQRKSKYVQADTEMIFREIEAKINAGEKVLFAGCPCQVAGLKACFQTEPENLYTIDIFCHGTPSIKMLRAELEEKLDGQKLAELDFRPKEKGWSQSSRWIKATTIDGKEHRILFADSAYEKGFHAGLTLRDSCYDCKFCDFPRQGDISLGDFWGIGGHQAELDDEYGTSAVLVNSEKGKKLFARAMPQFDKVCEAPIDWLKDNRISPKRAAHPAHPYFKFLMEQKTNFSDAVKTALAYRFRVGIVGPWMNINHGGALTYYALYEALREMGYCPTMISQPNGLEWSPDPQYCRFKKLPYPEYAIAPVKDGYAQQRELNDSCDAFIVGSDQLFTAEMLRLLDGYADLEWVDSNKKMIAYAASFAHDHFKGTEQHKKQLAYFLKRFDAFSVREQSGVPLLEQTFSVKAEWVLDPVFLCDAYHFEALAKNGMERVPSRPYVFGYILDPDRQKEQVIQNVAKAFDVTCHAVTDASSNPQSIKAMWDVETLTNVQNEELLAHIQNSEYVVTDSFHGVCFAILLKKNFVAIVNSQRGAARFHSLLSLFHLEGRMVENAEQATQVVTNAKPIDYDEVFRLLEIEKVRCKTWLRNAIEAPKAEKELSDYDMAMVYADRLQKILEKHLKWDRDCLNGRIDWLIGHLEGIQRELEKTDGKQWQQLEDHRLRLDGIDARNADNEQQLQKHTQRMDEEDVRVADMQTTLEQMQDVLAKQQQEIQRLNELLRVPLKIKGALHKNPNE